MKNLIMMPFVLGLIFPLFGEGMAQNVLTEGEKAEGWTLLWDGQTTNGWVGVDTGCVAFPSHGWIMHEGVLTVLPCIFRCDDKKEFSQLPSDCGGNGGDLVTIEKFRDFDFKIDFRLTPRANSGIKYFYNEGKDNGTTLEYQLMHHEHPDQVHGHDGDHRLASLYDLMPAPVAEKVVGPVGEWNTARIISKGAHVEHWLNGVKVLEFDRGSPAFRAAVKRSKYATWGTDGRPWGELVEGRILLQDHKDSTVSFRNIKIRRLVAQAANLAEFKGEVGESAGWKCVGSEAGKVVYIPFEGYYESKGGRIESPRFKLDGEIGRNSFYRLTFSAKCLVDGYWWVDFFDKDGVQLPDVNSRLYASEEWKDYDVMVPAHPAAEFAQIAFVTRKGARAKDVSIRRATIVEAAKWCDNLAATLPKLDMPDTKEAWLKLPSTMEKIRSGRPVNIVFLGDSIMNDTWCGNAVALIQSALPQADLRCFISVRGSTGCWYYNEKKNFDEYVTKYNPDLVVIGGISNCRAMDQETVKFSEDAMAETIVRCRAIGAEVVVCTPPPSYEFRSDVRSKEFDIALTSEKNGMRCLLLDYERRAAARTGAQVWDLTTAPCEAISRSGKPLNWFKRDAAHNDDRGKQLIAQTLAAYFKAVNGQ